MKHSIRLKITLTLVLTVASAIFLCWFINKTFLQSYYQYSKLKVLDNAFYETVQIYRKAAEDMTEGENKKGNGIEDGIIDQTHIQKFDLSDEIISRIDQIAGNKNVTICIYDISGGYIPAMVRYVNGTWSEAERIYRVALRYMWDYRMLGAKTEWLKAAKDYDVFKLYEDSENVQPVTGYNNENNNCFIDLIGKLDEQTIIVLRTNFESIQESVNISNKFLSYVGFITVIVGAVVMFIISRTFTKPILEMSVIAKKMTDLDFEVSYPVKRQDEIGELGSSINMLSKKLESTISELKSANNQMQKDIAKKIQIDEMRKEFLSNVTHELKTPIALIQGYAEGLLDNINDDAESRDFYCSVIVDEAAKMNIMVKKLLSLNQIEFGAYKVEMERFDITALIQSVIHSVAILLKQNEITVYFDTKKPVYVWADEYMIEEVITNYVSNAIHHADGSKIIEIKLIQNKDLVRAAVFNTGDLIPEEDIDKVWIKFYKADKARTREYGGNGIGLSIVKAIMDAHNKNYGVVNHVNGVEFWFELDAHVN